MITPVHRTGLVYDEVYLKHQVPPHHPEHPGRMDAVIGNLHKLESLLHSIKPHKATDEQLSACHDPSYIALVKKEITAGALHLSTGDTEVSSDSLEVALYAAGGACSMVDAVVSKNVDNGFCAVRPPGHHATRNLGMGFCVFNNVAVAARHAQKKHGCERILIVDWDVHHGNGTQDIFYDDDSVLFFSVHQSPFYPGTGAASETGCGPGKGTTINCPLPAGTTGQDVMNVFQSQLIPAAKDFKPDLVFISAGFDSRIDDPLGDWLLSDRDFAELTALVMDCASHSAGGRIVSVLEGGYNLEGLGSAAASHIETLVTG